MSNNVIVICWNDTGIKNMCFYLFSESYEYVYIMYIYYMLLGINTISGFFAFNLLKPGFF